MASAANRREGDDEVSHDGPRSALRALAGLLGEFRRGNFASLSDERGGMERHTGSLTAQWDERFPGFPSQHFPYTSFRGEFLRRRRDDHLKGIIVQLLADRGSDEATIVNPACVFGWHAADLSSRLPRVRVIATDIEPNWSRLYALVRGRRFPRNYSFMKDDIFDPRLDLRPTAVVFFGACGAVSDGAMDFAVATRAPYLMCRTCCHDNIGGNLEVVRRPGSVNRFFRFKNRALGRMKTKARYAGYYFSERYARAAYPRSDAGRGVSTSDEFQAVARHSADSDICRTIIDLDRYLLLVERGYRVFYQGELFVAERGEQGTR